MILINDLQKIIGQRTALDIETLSVASGQICAVAGPAGSGIDTLFGLLTGKLRPSAGAIRLAATHPADKNAFSRTAGVLFPDDGLYRRNSAQANLELQCRLYGLPRARALEVLQQIGMADQAQVKVEKLPSGLQRRLAIGRAILHDPAVLLLYEPFARCDEETIALLSQLIRDLANDGAAILVLIENTTFPDSLCDQSYLLYQGKLSAAPRPSEPRLEPAPFKIPVRLEDKVVLVNPADILYVEAEGGATYLKTAERSIPTQFTLGELEARLARSGFFRAHRGYLVNLQHAIEVIPYTRNSFSLRLDDASRTEIPLSKSAASELRELLGY